MFYVTWVGCTKGKNHYLTKAERANKTDGFVTANHTCNKKFLLQKWKEKAATTCFESNMFQQNNFVGRPKAGEAEGGEGSAEPHLGGAPPAVRFGQKRDTAGQSQKAFGN